MDSSDQNPTLILLEEGAEIPKYKWDDFLNFDELFNFSLRGLEANKGLGDAVMKL